MQSQNETLGIYKVKIINAKSKRDKKYVQSKNKSKVKKRK